MAILQLSLLLLAQMCLYKEWFEIVHLKKKIEGANITFSAFCCIAKTFKTKHNAMLCKCCGGVTGERSFLIFTADASQHMQCVIIFQTYL